MYAIFLNANVDRPVGLLQRGSELENVPTETLGSSGGNEDAVSDSLETFEPGSWCFINVDVGPMVGWDVVEDEPAPDSEVGTANDVELVILDVRAGGPRERYPRGYEDNPSYWGGEYDPINRVHGVEDVRDEGENKVTPGRITSEEKVFGEDSRFHQVVDGGCCLLKLCGESCIWNQG